MIIISDTTPIISLIKINRLDLLEKLFVEVLISDVEVKSYLNQLKNTNIRLSDSLIQQALSLL